MNRADASALSGKPQVSSTRLDALSSSDVSPELSASRLPRPTLIAQQAPAEHKPPTRHALLKAATTASHQALDHFVQRQGYFDSVAAYTNYMRRMQAFQCGFDRSAAGINDVWLTEWSIRERSGWLSVDVAALQAATGLYDEAPSDAAPDLQTPSALLGALYVVIGAGLGSRVLAARSAAIGLPPTGGNVYLTSLGETTRWGAFIRFLEAAPLIDTNQLTAGALATFACVTTHLSEPSAP